MEHMKEALKKKMLEMKGHHNKETLLHEKDQEEGEDDLLHEAGESAAEEEAEHEGSDLAPNLDHKEHEVHPKMEMGDADHDPMGGADAGSAMLGHGSPEHMAILKGLADSGHMGREGRSLHERAAHGAQGALKKMGKKY